MKTTWLNPLEGPADTTVPEAMVLEISPGLALIMMPSSFPSKYMALPGTGQTSFMSTTLSWVFTGSGMGTEVLVEGESLPPLPLAGRLVVEVLAGAGATAGATVVIEVAAGARVVEMGLGAPAIGAGDGRVVVDGTVRGGTALEIFVLAPGMMRTSSIFRT